MRRVSACADTVSTKVDTQPKALQPRIHSLEMWVIVRHGVAGFDKIPTRSII
jgi:hypothetical protein